MAKSKYPGGYSFKKKKKKSRFSLFLVLLTAIYTLAVFLSFFGKLSWITDLFSHFALQYFFVGLTLALLLLMARRKSWALLAACLALVQIVPLQKAWNFEGLMPEVSYNYPGTNVDTIQDDLRLFQHNLYRHNRKKQAIVDRILDQQNELDIVVLQEVSPEWIAFLEPLKDAFLYHDIKPRTDSFGYAVFSRIPSRRIEEFGEGPDKIALLRAYTRDKLIPFSLVLVHTMPPMSNAHWKKRNETLMRLSTVIKAEKNKHIILAGDLNLTPYSPWFDRVREMTGLKHPPQAFDRLGTWPGYMPSFMRIPIDHSLVSNSVQITNRILKDDKGSDHLAMVTEMTLYEREEGANTTAKRNQVIDAAKQVGAAEKSAQPAEEKRPAAPKTHTNPDAFPVGKSQPARPKSIETILKSPEADPKSESTSGHVKTNERTPAPAPVPETVETKTRAVVETSLDNAPENAEPAAGADESALKTRPDSRILRATASRKIINPAAPRPTQKPQREKSAIERAVEAGILPESYLKTEREIQQQFSTGWEPLDRRGTMPAADTRPVRRAPGNYVLEP